MEDKKRIKENEKGSKNKPKQNITNTSPNPNVSSFLMWSKINFIAKIMPVITEAKMTLIRYPCITTNEQLTNSRNNK